MSNGIVIRRILDTGLPFLYLTSMKQNTSVTRLRVPHPHTQTVQTVDGRWSSSRV